MRPVRYGREVKADIPIVDFQRARHYIQKRRRAVRGLPDVLTVTIVVIDGRALRFFAIDLEDGPIDARATIGGGNRQGLRAFQLSSRRESTPDYRCLRGTISFERDRSHAQQSDRGILQ